MLVLFFSPARPVSREEDSLASSGESIKLDVLGAGGGGGGGSCLGGAC